MPKAQIVACFSSSSASWAKSSTSFGLELGKAGLDHLHPERVEGETTRAFSDAESDIPSPCMPSRKVVS